jgi:uncharacterized protein involved in exopolysaccharide biosynthesis
MGQLQSQLQLEGTALARAQQQKSYLQSMVTQLAPVVDLDDQYTNSPPEASGKPGSSMPQVSAARSALAADKARLATLLTHYTEKHPEVRKLKKQIEDEEAKVSREAKETKANATVVETTPPPSNKVSPRRAPPVPDNYVNPVLQAQMKEIDDEIAKHKEEQQRLTKMVAAYQARLEVIPVREQQMTELVRDYEMSRAHYSQLLDKQLSAETATQLEIRQKGEKFTVLDPGQVPGKPSRPNRNVINASGSLAGLGLGLFLALVTEFLGMSITGPEQVTVTTGLQVLEVIPVIRTQIDRLIWRRRMIWATASGVAIALIGGAVLLYHYRSQFF